MLARALWLLLLLPVAVLRPAVGQDVSVQASVSALRIGLDDRVAYRLQLGGVSLGEVGAPRAPATEGLVLVQPFPRVEQRTWSAGGRAVRGVVAEWIYRPLRPGTARFLPAELTLRGRTLRTGEIRVEVIGGSTAPPPPPPVPRTTPGGAGPPEVFLRALPAARSVVQNGQVTVEYRLYFADHLEVRQSRPVDSWDAAGFWREELDVDLQPLATPVVENGRHYRMFLLKRVAVFPARPGTLRIDPLRIETEVFPSARSSDPFARLFSGAGGEKVGVASPPVTLSVAPLPPGAPPSFGGAVGRYRLTSTVDREAVEVGGSVTLTVTVAGTGNLATLALPPPAVPGVFERYDPEVTTAIDRSGTRIGGTKTFRYVLVPRSNGTFTLPAPELSFFDPEAGRYVTVRGAAATVRVTGTPGPAATPATGAGGLPVDDIAGPLPASGPWLDAGAPPLHARPLVWALLAAPLLALGGVLALRRRARRQAADADALRQRRAATQARRHFRHAEAVADPRAFFAEIERALLGFVSDRLGFTATGLSRRALDARLAAAGLPEGLRQAVGACLDACDRGRFAPDAPDAGARAAALDAAARTVADVEAFLERESVGPATTRALLPLLLLPLVAAAAPADEAARLVDAGNRRYTAGDYRGALDAYRRAEGAGRVSGALYYNAGNACYRLDSLGCAVLYYERAARLLPHRAEVAHNLALARARVTDPPPALPEPVWAPLWRLATAPGATGLFTAGFMLYLLAAALAGYRLWSGRRSDALRRVLALSAAAAVVLLGLGLAASAERRLDRRAVVVAPVAALRERPQAGPGRPVHAGVVVRVVGREGSMLKVRLPDGAEGWLDAAALRSLFPLPNRT